MSRKHGGPQGRRCFFGAGDMTRTPDVLNSAWLNSPGFGIVSPDKALFLSNIMSDFTTLSLRSKSDLRARFICRSE